MISKGKVFITHDELKRLFNMSHEVEFISVQDNGEGFEFNIASQRPVGSLTIPRPNWEGMRRQRVPRTNLTPSSQNSTSYCQCGNPSGQRYQTAITRGIGYLPSIKCADCNGVIGV